MKTEEHLRVKCCFDFFKLNLGNEIRISDIRSATGWKDSTIRTYFNKKWKGVVLERVSNGIYKVIMPSNMEPEGFGALHTQVSPNLS